MNHKKILQKIAIQGPYIQNHTVRIHTIQLIISHIPHANLFWIAPTYSGFWFFTSIFPRKEIGENFGHQTTFIKKSIKNQITIICINS